MGAMFHFLKQAIRLISKPVLGAIEGLIAAVLMLIFMILRMVEGIASFIQNHLTPMLLKMKQFLASLIQIGVEKARAFHRYMSEDDLHSAKPRNGFIKPLNRLLTPIYVLSELIYQSLSKLNAVISKDLASLVDIATQKWGELSRRYQLNQANTADGRKRFAEQYSASDLYEKYQQFVQTRFTQFQVEWALFTAELLQVWEQTKQIYQNKKVKDSVDQLSAFMQERNNIVVASVLINILALAFPLLMLQLYDRILSHRSIDTLVVFCVAVGVAVALEAIIRIFRSYSTAWISARFEHQGYVSLTSRYLAEPINEFERKGTGAILEEYKSISTLRYHYSGQTFQQLMDLPFTALYVLIIFFISPLIGIVLLAGYTAFVFITWKNGLTYPAIIKEQKEMDLRRGNLLTEILKNVHTMKSMTMESLMLRRYERLQESCAILMSRVTYALEMSAGVGAVFSPLMTVAVVAIGSWLVISNQLSNGEMAACIMLGLRALSPLQRLGGMWSKHQQDQILRPAKWPCVFDC